MSGSTSINPWRWSRVLHWLGFLAGVSLILVVFQAPLEDILARARKGVDQGYILLVPLVAAYLVFLRRSRLRGERGRWGGWVGIPLLLVSFWMMLHGHDRDILFLWHAAPILAFVAMVVAALGVRRTTLILPGVIVLFAMVPLPGIVRQWLAGPLQEFATIVTAFILDLGGVPAVRAGSLIEINGVPVAVGEACNGMRLVMPLVLVMYAFVFSLPLRAGTRLLIVLMSVPVALTCNVVRLVPTAIAYGYFPRVAGEVHDVGGWLMIPLAIALLLGLLRFLEWIDLPVSRYRLAIS